MSDRHGERDFSIARHSHLYLALVIAGMGTGWLVGLSVSPAVQVVIATVTASAAAIIASLSGIEKGQRSSDSPGVRMFANPWPLAVLVVGVVIGSGIGVFVRANNWLAGGAPLAELSVEHENWAGLERSINKWSKLTGKTSGEVASAIFESRLARGTYVILDGEETEDQATEGVLYGIGRSDVCDDLLSSSESAESMRRKLENHPIPNLRVLANVEEGEVLVKIVRDIMCLDEGGE